MYTQIFEKVPVFTGTTPKPMVYDSEQPRNHTREKTEGRGQSGEEEKGLLALTIFILPTSDKKALMTHLLRHLDQAVSFSKIQVDMEFRF